MTVSPKQESHKKRRLMKKAFSAWNYIHNRLHLHVRARWLGWLNPTNLNKTELCLKLQATLYNYQKAFRCRRTWTRISKRLYNQLASIRRFPYETTIAFLTWIYIPQTESISSLYAKQLTFDLPNGYKNRSYKWNSFSKANWGNQCTPTERQQQLTKLSNMDVCIFLSWWGKKWTTSYTNIRYRDVL